VALTYSRDDASRLIVVTASDIPQPVSVAETLAAIDRQWSEGTWDYALLYDYRGTSHVTTPEEAELLQEHVKRVGLGKPRGPVGLAVATRDMVRRALLYSDLTRKSHEFELLITESQVEAWLARHRHVKGAKDPIAPRKL
jgi:hypothetical protein